MIYHDLDVLTFLAMAEGFFLRTMYSISAVAADNEYLMKL